MVRRSAAQLQTRVIHCGDNLAVLPQLPDSCVDLIYIDPPFNSNRDRRASRLRGKGGQSPFAGTAQTVLRTNGDCPLFPRQDHLGFSDRNESTAAYIEFLRPRCVELARVLKPTGSFYCHCDWHASHYIKVLLDDIFGQQSFINEIIWAYESGGRATRHFHRKHDVILLYSPAAKARTYTFHGQEASVPRNVCPACGTRLAKWNNLKQETDANGRVCRTIRSNGKLYRYYDDQPVVVGDVWHISHLQQKDPQRVGYPTQKPLALLDRIIRVSSNPGDVVLDAFCGSGTTLVAAEQAGRRWIGIDLSSAACRLAAERLQPVCRREPSQPKNAPVALKRSRKRTGGFSLVELLVVITILGILIAMLLPAVQAAREAARRIQCQNNLKQIAMAVLGHEQQVGHFPTGGWGWNWIGDPDRGTGADQPGGWIYNILPFLEQTALYQLGSGGTAAEKHAACARRIRTPLVVMNCPSRRQTALFDNSSQVCECDMVDRAARGDYAVNAGDTADFQPSEKIISLDQQPKPWQDTSRLTGVCFQRSMVRTADVCDGLSNTYLAGEKSLAVEHYYAGTSGGDNENLYTGVNVDHTRVARADVKLMPDSLAPDDPNKFAFGSAHAGGLNMAYCDGSVHTISYEIEPFIHAALANRKDGLPLGGTGRNN